MKKPLICLYLLLIALSALTGCQPYVSTQQTLTSIPSVTWTPIATVEPSLSSTVILPTPTVISSPIPSATMTPFNTLEPGIANETIKKLLAEPVDCAAPCFWGIIPGQTTLDGAINIISHFGLPVRSQTVEGKEFTSTNYDFASGLSIRVTLTLQTNVVENLRVILSPEQQKKGTAREWSAYSPETLIQRYGNPSRVEFNLGLGERSSFSMQMFFDEETLIAQYSGYDITKIQNDIWKICPLTAQLDDVRVWMGKNPVYPPTEAISLQKATSLTLDEFTKLMIGDPNQACFIINVHLLFP